MPSSSRVQSEHPEDHANGDQLDDANGPLTFTISRKELLSLQIRSLLDASDEVDLSAEVAEDLLQSLPSDSEEGACCAHDGAEDDESYVHEHAEQNDEDEDEDGVDITAIDGEISFSSIFKPDDGSSPVQPQ